jgi:hypothetical protein
MDGSSLRCGIDTVEIERLLLGATLEKLLWLTMQPFP